MLALVVGLGVALALVLRPPPDPPQAEAPQAGTPQAKVRP
jgi:hypothetical protein